MSASRIANRYAKSLLDLAIEQNQLDALSQEVKSFQASIAESRDLSLLLKSPIINPRKKLACVKAIYEGKVSQLFYNFLALVVQKRREIYLPEIANAFVQQFNEKKGIGTAVLITASPVNDELIERLQKMVLQNYKGIKTVEFTTKIDASLLGGFILEFNDQRYDSSVASQLKSLKQNFSVNNILN